MTAGARPVCDVESETYETIAEAEVYEEETKTFGNVAAFEEAFGFGVDRAL